VRPRYLLKYPVKELEKKRGMRMMQLSANNDTNIWFCILEKSKKKSIRLEENGTMQAY